MQLLNYPQTILICVFSCYNPFMDNQNFLWSATSSILKPVLRVFCRFKVYGLKNISDIKKPIIFAIATHSYFLDPYIVGIVIPRHFYPVRFMTKSSFFKMPLVKHIVRAYGAFPIIRGQGLENTLKPAIDFIKQGEPVGLFTEGKISASGELRPARPGAAALSILTNTPIVPVALKGTWQIRNLLKLLFLRKRISVSFGQPIFPPDNANPLDKETLNQFTQIIEDKIKTLYYSI